MWGDGQGKATPEKVMCQQKRWELRNILGSNGMYEGLKAETNRKTFKAAKVVSGRRGWHTVTSAP